MVVRSDDEFKTKEYKIETMDKTEPQHIQVGFLSQSLRSSPHSPKLAFFVAHRTVFIILTSISTSAVRSCHALSAVPPLISWAATAAYALVTALTVFVAAGSLACRSTVLVFHVRVA